MNISFLNNCTVTVGYIVCLVIVNHVFRIIFGYKDNAIKIINKWNVIVECREATGSNRDPVAMSGEISALCISHNEISLSLSQIQLCSV